MKRTFCSDIFISIILGCLSLDMLGQSPMPEPKKAEFGQGRFSLQHATILITDTNAVRERMDIDEFVLYVKSNTGIDLAVSHDSSQSATPLIVVSSEHPDDDGLPVPGEKAGKASRDWYHIKISPEKIILHARTNAGLFYALQSLRQLIRSAGKDAYLEESDLEDYPSFAFRGIMMDFAHGGLLTEAEIKRQIDFLSRWKINQYYFYNEVSIEMPGYPLLNYHAGYSQQQISRIIAFGREKHVDVIPFVNFYGHLHELLRIQKYADLGIGKYGHDLDPRKPEVQNMLKDWIQQYALLFPSPFIHVGFDETWETKRLSKNNKTIVPDHIYTDHLDFVTGELMKYGKTPMVWTDISKSYPGIIARFPKAVIPVVWDYGDDPMSVGNWIKPIEKEKMPFFIQSGVDGWAHIYPTETTWNNIDICLQAAGQHNAPGYITSVWTDAIQPLLRNSWLFMAYGAAVSWSGLPVERNKFIKAYCQVAYPAVSEQMKAAFTSLAESQVLLRKCLGQTQTHMWENPFLPYNLKNTREHLTDFVQSRLAAEKAQEFLMDALRYATADSAFIQTLLLNSRLLSYTSMRFLWAKKMNDRWDESLRQKDDSWYADITETPHGLIMDMLDYATEIKEEYIAAWLSENMPYRLGTISGRFDSEYLFWRGLSSRVLDYHYNNTGKGMPRTFAKTFGLE